MRSLFVSAIIGIALFHASPSAADERRGSVQGFGGVTLGTRWASMDTSFGGMVLANLTPNIQALGEAGRLSNVLPSTSNLLGFSPVGFGLSAWYAEGGVRFTTSPGTGVRPYVETAAGIARLRTQIDGLGALPGGVLTLAGLRFLDRTDPIASVGGGVTLEAGHFLADFGYRYRRVFSSSWMNALAPGDSLHSNEVRVGIGVRF
jgi:hypothetical protein